MSGVLALLQGPVCSSSGWPPMSCSNSSSCSAWSSARECCRPTVRWTAHQDLRRLKTNGPYSIRLAATRLTLTDHHLRRP
jgi:hypothetical protein